MLLQTALIATYKRQITGSISWKWSEMIELVLSWEELFHQVIDQGKCLIVNRYSVRLLISIRVMSSKYLSKYSNKNSSKYSNKNSSKNSSKYLSEYLSTYLSEYLSKYLSCVE